MCWGRAPLSPDAVAATWLLVASQPASRAARATPAVSRGSSRAVAALFDGHGSAAPSLRGACLALALAQRLAADAVVPLRVLVVTCDALATAGAPATSEAAHGGAWGLARVLRLEHTALRAQNADVVRGARPLAARALTTATDEAEVVWLGGTRCAARLRARAASSTRRVALSCGAYAITGGLGGLGLRAAASLVEGGASCVVVASRGGRVGHNGQGLAAQLAALHVAARVSTADAGDAADALALVATVPFAGVLHAAGVGDKGLLAQLEGARLRWMHAAKACGAWSLHCATALTPFCARVLYSSVGSGLGNVGQANYAAANACLDAHALSRRVQGAAACSLQWPLVGGAGMGAAAFAAMGERQVAIAGLAGISLEAYAACLSGRLATCGGVALSVQLAHRSDVREVLRDLADGGQRRFGELAGVASRARSAAGASRPAPSVAGGVFALAPVPLALTMYPVGRGRGSV